MYHILIAEDDLASQEMYEQVLSAENYMISTVETGAEALAHLANSPVDLLILDLHLPEVSGVEVIQQMNVMGLDTLIVLVSADVLVEVLYQTQQADFSLTKPFRASQLLTAVRTFLH